MRSQTAGTMPGISRIVFVIQLLACMQPAWGQWFPYETVQSPAPLEYELAMKDADSSPIALPLGFTPLPSEDLACEIYVPSRYRAEKPAGLLLHLSPGPRSQAARPWKSVFDRQGLLYASPHGIGNRVPVKHRVETTIAVLHHMRTKYNVDPDRVYLVGFSGGARLATMIGFAYPEYFGGIVAIGSGGLLPKEPWMFDRIQSRLRVGLIVGRRDGFRREVELQTFTLLKESKINTKLWLPNTGHVLPSAKVVTEIVKWLDDGLDERRELASNFPATRIADSPDADEWSDRLFAEAKQRLTDPNTLRSGVVTLQAVFERWPETEAAAKTQELHSQHDADEDAAWKSEQRVLKEARHVADTKSNEAFATADLPIKSLEHMRASTLQNAIAGWHFIAISTRDDALRTSAEQKVRELTAIANKQGK